MVTSETAVDQTWVGGGSFWVEISPNSLTSCQTTSTMAGLISLSRPLPTGRRLAFAVGRCALDAVAFLAGSRMAVR